MEGKVANIVEEISSTDKVSEGLLKDLISGGNITVERKYQDPHIMTPTAKLTFATNNLPYIKDASHGFWRRMLILPFNVQIPEEEQNRDFSDSNFWRKSGELSGIFEWSVAGYQSLKKYGFSIPKSSKDLTEEYRLDTNPFRQWLLDNYEASPKGKVSMKEIKFRFQMDSHSERRYMPSNHTIKREIFREFRSVKWSKNPLTFDSGERSRCFLGLKAKIDCTLDTHIW